MTADPICDCCPGAEESLSHVLRDCTKAKQVWFQLIGRDYWFRFQVGAIDEWLTQNLSSTARTGWCDNWNLVFGFTFWFLWRWRNEQMFQGSNLMPSTAQRIILSYVKDILNASSLKEEPRTKKMLLVEARPGKELLDSTLMVLVRKTQARPVLEVYFGMMVVAGLRDSQPIWVSRPLCKLKFGECYGLELRWNEGYGVVELELDSRVLAHMIIQQKYDRRFSPMLWKIGELLGPDWTIDIHHCFRYCNSCADGLTNLGQGAALGVHWLDQAPLQIRELLQADCVGMSCRACYLL